MATKMLRPQIILFGDSLTEWSFSARDCGWGAALADRYMRKADVLNRGFGGYNTRSALHILDKIFPIHSLPGVYFTGQSSSESPIFVTVCLGANDAALPEANFGKTHVPLEEYKENLLRILSYLKAHLKSTHIVVIAPPPVDEKNLLLFAVINYGDTSGVPTHRNEITKLYSEACLKIANEAGLPVIDLWSIFQEKPDWHKLLSDGLHFSAEGNNKVFEELVKVLDRPELVPCIKADDLPFDYPEWSELDYSNLEAIFERWSTKKVSSTFLNR